MSCVFVICCTPVNICIPLSYASLFSVHQQYNNVSYAREYIFSRFFFISAAGTMKWQFFEVAAEKAFSREHLHVGMEYE